MNATRYKLNLNRMNINVNWKINVKITHFAILLYIYCNVIPIKDRYLFFFKDQ